MPLTISNSTRAALAFCLALCAAHAGAQRYTPEPPPLTTAPCKPTKKDPCPAAPTPTPVPATAPFPFPGETPEDAPPVGKVNSASSPGSSAPAPAATAPGGFPFPGERQSTPPATNAPGSFPFPGEPAAEPAGASSSSSSAPDSSDAAASDSDSRQPDLKDEGSTGSTRFSRRKLPKVTVIDNDAREARDLEVSHYYYTTGNFNAAYARAKDAVTTFPDDPAAHLALAESAVRLNKSDEAALEYNACLKLDATDPQIKAARKGLADLAAAQPARRAAK